MEPGHFRECDAFVRDSNGRLDVLVMAVQNEGDGFVDDLVDDSNSSRPSSSKMATGGGDVSTSEDMPTLESLSLQTGEPTRKPLASIEKKQKCNTCDAEVGDAAKYREHFKSEWHKHNLKRKVKQLPPVSSEEWMLDTEIAGEINDFNEYCR